MAPRRRRQQPHLPDSSAGDDCNKYGMVAGINVRLSLFPPCCYIADMDSRQVGDADLQMQYDMALDSPSVVQPSGAASGTPGASSSVGGPSPRSMAAMAIGIVVGIVLAAAFIWWWWWWHTRSAAGRGRRRQDAGSGFLQGR